MSKKVITIRLDPEHFRELEMKRARDGRKWQELGEGLLDEWLHDGKQQCARPRRNDSFQQLHDWLDVIIESGYNKIIYAITANLESFSLMAHAYMANREEFERLAGDGAAKKVG